MNQYLDVVQTKKYKFYAICDSEECLKKKVRRDNRRATTLGVVKLVPKTAAWCEDCGSALFWHKEEV